MSSVGFNTRKTYNLDFVDDRKPGYTAVRIWVIAEKKPAPLGLPSSVYNYIGQLHIVNANSNLTKAKVSAKEVQKWSNPSLSNDFKLQLIQHVSLSNETRFELSSTYEPRNVLPLQESDVPAVLEGTKKVEGRMRISNLACLNTLYQNELVESVYTIISPLIFSWGNHEHVRLLLDQPENHTLYLVEQKPQQFQELYDAQSEELKNILRQREVQIIVYSENRSNVTEEHEHYSIITLISGKKFVAYVYMQNAKAREKAWISALKPDLIYYPKFLEEQLGDYNGIQTIHEYLENNQ